MSKHSKILLGVITVFPLLLMLFFLSIGIWYFYSHFNGRISFDLDKTFIMEKMFIFVIIGGFLGLVHLITTIYYISRVFLNNKFDDTQQILWVLLLIFFNTIGTILYWYLYIWKDEENNFHRKNIEIAHGRTY